jgi:hypothetical protein
MDTDLFSSANRNATSQQLSEEATSRRISSLFAAVREQRARTGRGIGLRRPDDALARHSRGLYERP